jgi:hypothetical protein
MLSGSMTKGSVRITASPSQDGSTVNDEITSPDEPPSNGLQSREDKERFVQRAPAMRRRLHCCDGLGMRRCPPLSNGKPQAKAGQLCNQSCIS